MVNRSKNEKENENEKGNEKANEKELLTTSLKLLKDNLKVKKGEKILVIDDGGCKSVVNAIMKAGEKLGEKIDLRVKKVKISKTRAHSAPIPEIKNEMIKSDIIIAPTAKSISHSPETIIARKKYSARVASMPGITLELFLFGMKTDPKKIRGLNYRIYRCLKDSKFVNIITQSGTNLRVYTKNINFETGDCGDISKKGVLNNVPFGEVCGWVTKGVGKIVIDCWEKKIKPEDGAWIYIRRGKIVEWNKKAEVYVKNQKKAGECGLRIIELGFGTNYMLKNPIGNILHDEKIYGTVHVAFGGHEPERKCPIHEDVILLKPSVWVDGIKIMENGRLIK